MEKESVRALNEWIENLREWGAEPDAAISRMVDDKELYFRLLKRFRDNRRWEALQEALGEKRYSEAFKIAHDLKGNAAILSLTPLWKRVCDVVEDLREEIPAPGLDRDLEELLGETIVFERIMSEKKQDL